MEWARRMAVNVAQGSGLREKEHATGAVGHRESPGLVPEKITLTDRIFKG